MDKYLAKRSEITSDVLKLLQYSSFFNDSCKIILEKLCAYADAEVAYITVLENSQHITYKYHNESAEFIAYTKSAVDAKNDFPELTKALAKTSIVYRDCTSTSRGCGKDFDAIGYKNCLCYSVKSEGEIVAYIIACDNAENREWDDEVVAIMCDFAHVLAGLFMSKKTHDELLQTNMTFKTVVDNMDSCVFVSNPDSGKIIFANEKLNDMFGENVVGKTATELFGDELFTSYDSYGIDNRNTDYHFKATDRWFDVSEATVSWIDGKTVNLTTLYDISDKIEYERLIEKQALFDNLTDLPNKLKLERDFNYFSNESKRLGKSSYMLILDLDNFQNINDTRGHSFGDRLLRKIANYLRGFESDGIFPYRFGGDEFVLILPATCTVDVNKFAKSLIKYFNHEWNIDETLFYCTASIGIAEFPERADTYLEIMKRCDMSVSRAKKLGKNKIIKYEDKIGAETYRRIELENQMRNDILDDFRNFSLHYQPIINTRTQKLEGCEALLRWKTEKFGKISPCEFIPIAEKNGYISDLGEFVFKEAAKQCKNWVDSGFNLKVNINLSIGQLAESDFVDKVTSIINETQVPYCNIMLEVTESMAINDIDKIKETLNQISGLGIKIALDDFGTGYSSLNCLKEMPLSTIKIDKTFIDDIVNNPSTAVFVRTIVNLSHDLHMRVCAEGVEQKEQYDVLRQLDTDVIQGYYFGRPISADSFEKNFLRAKASEMTC